MSVGYSTWKLAFELSPIILVNGLVDSFPGSVLPIVAITEILNFPLGLLSGGSNIGLNNFFAHFRPVPGTSLLTQDVARYPFANSTVAANAVVSIPPQVSYLMTATSSNAFGYWERLALITTLRETLNRHNTSGGTYTIVTPSYIFTNCLFKDMRDASDSSTKQPQNTWQLDFEKPLLTLDDAERAQNGLFSAIENGLKTGLEPVWSGLQAAAQIPSSLAGIATMPAQVSSVAAQTPGAASLSGGLLGPI